MRALMSALFAWLALAASSAGAFDQEAVRKLATGDSDERTTAIAALVAEGDARARDILQALTDSELYTAGERILVIRGDAAVDAITAEKVSPLPEPREEIILNNRLRRELGAALAALDLLAPDPKQRLSAVEALSAGAEPSILPLVRKALASETEASIKAALERVKAKLEVRSGDAQTRLAAIRKLGESDDPATKALETEQMIARLQVRMERVEKRMAEARTNGDSAAAERDNAILLRLRHRTARLASRVLELRAEAADDQQAP